MQKTFLSQIFTHFLDFLFPYFCLDCKAQGTPLCGVCIKKIEVPDNPLPPPSEFFEGLFAAGIYHEENLMAKLIHQYKYGFSFRLVDFLAPLLIKTLEPFSEILKDGIFIPVPLHSKRKRWRGFNQSELLAEKIAEHFHMPVEMRKLIRTRHTEPQALLTREERLKNVENAFFFMKGPNIPQKIFLVDDVVSTGQTMHECAKAIKNQMPDSKLYAVVLAIPR